MSWFFQNKLLEKQQSQKQQQQHSFLEKRLIHFYAWLIWFGFIFSLRAFYSILIDRIFRF